MTVGNKIWTDEQLRAISHPANAENSGPVLVSAAAGSGKTAVLVERVIRLLTAHVNPVRADKIVLVTFTRKAAAEMKERLVKALQLCLDSCVSAGTALVRKQLIRIEEAQITTINAFCLNLLRENSVFAGLEPGFKIAEDEELELLAKAAMAATLEGFYDGDSGEIMRTCEFFGGNGDSGLRTAIRDLYRFTRNIPDGESWIDEQLELYENPNIYYNKIVPKYYSLIKKEIAKAIELINESMAYAEYDGTQKSLQEELDFFEGFYDDWKCNTPYPTRRTTDKKEDDSVKELVKENREKTKKAKESVALSAELIAAFKDSAAGLEPIIKTLARLKRSYADNFSRIKRAKNVIDFSDSEHLFLELLRNNNRVRERICGDYELLIVDEFQDSNYLQYEIFRLLSRNNNLFFVGDMKQSIYRFRGADSAVFNEVSQNPDYEVMYLSKNFRSSNQVIESVNNIFKNIMPNYDENAALKPGRQISESDYATELCLLSEEDNIDNIDGLEVEARYTAFRIKQMVSEGFEVANKNGSLRKCGWGDFAVLSSAGEKNFRVYEKVFREQGIPCVSSGVSGYLKTEEVGLALDLLMVINNPYNDLSLFNIMMSPLYGFTAEEVAVCRMFRMSRTGRRSVPLYSALMNAQHKLKSEKAADFLKSIARYRRIADISSVSELIAVINGEGGFLPLVADGHKKANIRLLSYYAERFSQNRADSSLSAFLAYIKDLKNIDADIRQANVGSQSVNSVRLMTIHGSKGLEFPICFVARVNQRFNFREQSSASKSSVLARFERHAGIAADYFDSESLCRFKTLHSDYAVRLNREYTIAEEIRKLYVAATRAECKLIFTGYGKPKEGSYLEWLSPCLESKSRFLSMPPPSEGEGRHCRQEEDEFAQILTNINSVYSREILGEIPRKLTATQVGVVKESRVVGDEADEPSVFPRNPSFHREGRLTGKKRGDAYHKAMELIDFSAGDYTGQLQRLEHRFAPLEYKAINPKHIEGFFNSELGKRAVNSEKVVKEYKLYTEIEFSELGYNVPYNSTLPFVQGIADMFFYENGEIVLVDYKTNRNTPREKLVHDYKGQLSIYKKAIEEMTGVRVKECRLYSFEIGDIPLC